MNIYTCLLTETPNDWHRELIGSLEDMGQQVFSPKDIGLCESWHRLESGCWSYKHKAQLSQRLLEDVRDVIQKEGLDLFFVLLFPFQFEPKIFREIERLGIPTVLFYCDNLQSHDVVREFAPYFTLNWVPELEAAELYKKKRCNYLYLPMAANPNLNKPLDREEKREVVFIGGKTPYRRWLLGSSIAQGLPLEIYGNYWRDDRTYYQLDHPPKKRSYHPLSLPEKISNFFEKKSNSLSLLARYGLRLRRMKSCAEKMGEEFENIIFNHSFDPVSPSRLIELYAESKVNLGINHYLDPGFTDLFNLTYSKVRDFEAPMSGACYLTQHTKELDHLYPQENVIMTYRSVDDMCEKVRILLKDKKLRDLMRKNARQFCLENHTWQHRFQKLFEKLGLTN